MASVLYGDDTRHPILSGRISGHWSEGRRVYGNKVYEFVPPTNEDFRSFGVASNWVYNDDTVLVDHSQPEIFQAGDKVIGILNPVAKSNFTRYGPAYRIMSKAGPTITMARLWRRTYYYTGSGGEDNTVNSLPIYIFWWAPGQTLSADTHGDAVGFAANVLTNVLPTNILKNGDWLLAASGLPTNCRVVSGEGTGTIILNKNATDTVSGKKLYFAQICEVGLTAI